MQKRSHLGCYPSSTNIQNGEKSQIRRLINFERMSDGRYRFSMGFYENKEIELKGFITDRKKDLEKYENVTSLLNLGTWEYPKICDENQIGRFLSENRKYI